MVKKYDYLTDVNNVNYWKRLWGEGYEQGNQKQMDEAAANAKTYYDSLINNGRGDVADVLKTKDASGAQKYLDDLSTAGQSWSRPYITNKIKNKFGAGAIKDSDITFNDATGEVYLYGKSLGKADYLTSDGKAYYDPQKLDKGIDEAAAAAGITPDKATLSKNQLYQAAQYNDQMVKDDTEYDKLIKDENKRFIDYQYDGSQYNSNWAKDIRKIFDYNGSEAARDARASAAGSNGGNIDSLSAANAARQKLAFDVAGVQAIQNEFGERMKNVSDSLDRLGISRTARQNVLSTAAEEARKNSNEANNQYEEGRLNDQSILESKAKITGYVPEELNEVQKQSDARFFNEDGSLKEQWLDVDLQQRMIENNAIINNPDASQEQKNAAILENNSLSKARDMKTGMDKYAEHSWQANAWNPSPIETADIRQNRENNESAERINEYTSDANVKIAGEQAKASMYGADKDAAAGMYGADKDAAASMYVADKNAAASMYVADKKKDNAKPTLTAKQAASAIKNGEISQNAIDAYNYYYGTNYTVDNPPESAGSNAPDLLGNNDNSETDYTAQLNSVYTKSSNTVKDYIRNKLEPLITQNDVTETELKNHLIDNSKDYDLEVDDIKAICKALGVDTKWVDNYKNSGLFGWGSGVKER